MRGMMNLEVHVGWWSEREAFTLGGRLLVHEDAVMYLLSEARTIMLPRCRLPLSLSLSLSQFTSISSLQHKETFYQIKSLPKRPLHLRFRIHHISSYHTEYQTSYLRAAIVAISIDFPIGEISRPPPITIQPYSQEDACNTGQTC